MLRSVNREDIYYIKENVHNIYQETEYKSGMYIVHCYVTPIESDISVVRKVNIKFPDHIDPSKVDFLSCNINISSAVSGFYWTTVPIIIFIKNRFQSYENWYVRTNLFNDDGGHGYLKSINYGCIAALVKNDQIEFTILREARIDCGEQTGLFSKISSIEITYKKKVG